MSNLFQTNIEAKFVSYLKMKRTPADRRNFFIKNQKRKKDNPVQGQIPSSSQIVIEEHKTESLVSDLDIRHAIGVHLNQGYSLHVPRAACGPRQYFVRPSG